MAKAGTAIVTGAASGIGLATWRVHGPLRRDSKPEDIAAGIAFLVDGEQSSYVTGHVLAIVGSFSSGGTIRPMRTTWSPH